MSQASPEIQRATVGQARLIAEVHVRARRSAYRGLIPPEQLAAESVDDREVRWTKRLSNPQGRCWLLVEGAQLHGFAFTAPAVDEDLGPGAAELASLYLLPEAIGRGLGRRVTSHALEDLQARGFTEVVLWVAAENGTAMEFYAAAGFESDERTPAIPFGETGLTRIRLRRFLT